MLKFFRTIRKKLIEEDNIRKYLLYAVGEILLVVIGIFRPARDYLWVETMDSPNPRRAVRYGICRVFEMATYHMAYLPAGQAGLRHAVFGLGSVFYQYVVPTGQVSSAKSPYPQFPC